MFTAEERLLSSELALRVARCRGLLAERLPDAAGLLIFSRLNVYYYMGTLGNGVLWLPREGEAVLMVRKGVERCMLESPLAHIVSFGSFGDIPKLCAAAGSPLPDGANIAVEMGALPWNLANLLQSRLTNCHFVAGDVVLGAARSVKTAWEIAKMRIAGERHRKAVCEILPIRIQPGMTERAIAHSAWQIFFELGHAGPTRMGNFGEECFLGHISAGENGNYPSHFNGPLGLKGEHPAAPFMGNAHSVWQPGTPLSVDIGFVYEGYNTDKTQLYWAGPQSSIPDAVRRAHDASVDIQRRAAEALIPGAIPSHIWESAQARATTLGVGEGFMGLGANKVRFLGHGIGLVIDELPVLAPRFDAPLEAGMTIAIEPKIGIAGVGMVGVENTFLLTESGAVSLTGNNPDMICIE